MKVKFDGGETIYTIPFIAPGDKVTEEELTKALETFFFKGKEPTCSFAVQNLQETGTFLLKDECLTIEKSYAKVFDRQDEAKVKKKVKKKQMKRKKRWVSRSRSPKPKRRWSSPQYGRRR